MPVALRTVHFFFEAIFLFFVFLFLIIFAAFQASNIVQAAAISTPLTKPNLIRACSHNISDGAAFFSFDSGAEGPLCTACDTGGGSTDMNGTILVRLKVLPSARRVKL